MRLCMLMLLHGHCTGHVCTVDDCEVGFKPNIAALYGLLDLTMSCMSEMAINKTLTQSENFCSFESKEIVRRCPAWHFCCQPKGNTEYQSRKHVRKLRCCSAYDMYMCICA